MMRDSAGKREFPFVILEILGKITMEFDLNN